jgi:hypothetical protein
MKFFNTANAMPAIRDCNRPILLGKLIGVEKVLFQTGTTVTA